MTPVESLRLWAQEVEAGRVSADYLVGSAFETIKTLLARIDAGDLEGAGIEPEDEQS